MFQLSKAVEYAILFLQALKKKEGKPVSLALIAKSRGLPLKYLERIAGDLKRQNIIKSKEGTAGGYFLAKKPKNITLSEIITSVEGKKGFVTCIYGTCQQEKLCSHKKVWQKLQQALEKELGKISLTDF